jgi:hypothetical protein
VEAWLKQMGPPIHVAARYQPQQYLVGPMLFPIYWYVLRLALAWCAVIYVFAKVAEITANGWSGESALHAIVQLPWVLQINAAIVTLIFAGIERAGKWDPQKLFPLAGAQAAWPQGLVSPFDAGLDEQNKKQTYARAVALARAQRAVCYRFTLYPGAGVVVVLWVRRGSEWDRAGVARCGSFAGIRVGQNVH